LGEGGEDVLPMLVGDLMPAALVGIYIAVVLAAIMSTIDSLLVVAGSAAVRDVYQKILNPEISNDELVAMSRVVTVSLALAGLAIALGVALTTPGRTVFWFVIFGWSGIASTFCPTIILSLFWRQFTRKGALAAMVFGSPAPERRGVFRRAGRVGAGVCRLVRGRDRGESGRRGGAAAARRYRPGDGWYLASHISGLRSPMCFQFEFEGEARRRSVRAEI
ncbi:MAG: hypothetical protein ABEN55_08365, partial [Bradymonadaceae bacterium]